MAGQVWINLPVKDLNKSKSFFTEIGFSLNEGFGNADDQASLVIGDKNVILMLFPESTFQKFTGNNISDTTKGTEVLFSIGAESKEEVDEMVSKAVKAGGTIYGQPHDQGWMYGAGFVDLDGHRWNLLYMDMSQFPVK
ncbi:VOC family protein [Paenibacillus paridis]|uniref:VOC family protein n=1 Tax=Paenibacillus paridis TaxID=2583376 RepID=UPI0011243531|nr:VOC family protein [Paenibacillus paridis]